MSLMQRGLGAALNRLPKVINPTQHAIIDYALAATFFTAGAVLFKRHRRAGISAFLCGGAATVNSIITDYPGGLFQLINFETHGQVDAGLAGMTAAMPRLMGFGSDRESWFFDVQATIETAATALTDFHAYERPAISRMREAA